MDSSLGEFVKQLAALLQMNNVPLPFKNEEPWHLLFYELKETCRKGRPGFFDELRFDWDGPFPKCQELSNFLQALHWNASVSAANPHYDTIALPPAVAELWSKSVGTLPEDKRAFLDEALALAEKEFKVAA
jgi:hypothetical protein